MEIDLKKLHRSYEPYRRECGYVLVRDVCIMGAMLLVVGIIFNTNEDQKFYFSVLVPFIVIFCFIGLMLEIYVALLTILEEKKICYVAKSVRILKVKDALSWTGRMLESAMTKLYPPDVQMEPYWIYLITPTGKKFRLRCAMGNRKWEAMRRLMARMEKEDVYVTVVYGKYSRVLVMMKGDGYDIVDVNRLM